MSVYPIAWHKQRLEALHASRTRRAQEVRDAQERLDYCSREVQILEYQILEAQREGKAGFDPDKFRKGRT